MVRVASVTLTVATAPSWMFVMGTHLSLAFIILGDVNEGDFLTIELLAFVREFKDLVVSRRAATSTTSSAGWSSVISAIVLVVSSLSVFPVLVYKILF